MSVSCPCLLGQHKSHGKTREYTTTGVSSVRRQECCVNLLIAAPNMGDSSKEYYENRMATKGDKEARQKGKGCLLTRAISSGHVRHTGILHHSCRTRTCHHVRSTWESDSGLRAHGELVLVLVLIVHRNLVGRTLTGLQMRVLRS